MLSLINIYNNPEKCLEEKKQAMQLLLDVATELRKQKHISPFWYNAVSALVTGMATGALLGAITGGVAAFCTINSLLLLIILTLVSIQFWSLS